MLAVGLADVEADGQVEHVGRVVLDAHVFLVAKDFEVGVKARQVVHAGVELADVVAVVEGGGQVEAAALGGVQDALGMPSSSRMAEMSCELRPSISE